MGARMKCTYAKGDRVETPLGIGTIITKIEITGACKVKLDKPLKEATADGEQARQRTITANTFQMRHVGSWYVKGVNRYFDDEAVAWEFCEKGESPIKNKAVVI